MTRTARLPNGSFTSKDPSENCMRRPPLRSPLLPEGTEIVAQPIPFESCSAFDKFLVYASSLIVVGSPVWFYGSLVWLFRKWRYYRLLATSIKDQRTCSEEKDSQGNHLRYQKLARRYGVALCSVILLSLWGPHRSPRVGEWLGVRRWRLWRAWMNYIGFAVIQDRGSCHGDSSSRQFDPLTSPAILAFVPHGIFPFGLAFSCLPEEGYDSTWGLFRPVVATATKLFPLVRTFIAWMGGVDASRNAVSRSISQQSTGTRRIGLSPGGIAEMFETYPKPGFHQNDEAAILKTRNGIFKLACQHNVPVVPVYCFGATKMLRRVQLPRFIESLSRALQISICLFFGKWGLPIPFRQRLLYVIGNTIWPREGGHNSSLDFEEQVEIMHSQFTDEILRIFNRNKDFYGWASKSLKLV